MPAHDMQPLRGRLQLRQSVEAVLRHVRSVSLLGISEAAEKLGLHTVCGRVSLDNLAEAPLPCILHWNQNHFVVLYKVDVKKQKFYIADPGKGFAICRKKDMEKHWLAHVRRRRQGRGNVYRNHSCLL